MPSLMNCEPNINNAIVYDIGSAFIRSGHSGEGFPTVSQPSFAAYDKVSNEIFYPDNYLFSVSKNYEISYLIDDHYSIPEPNNFSHFLNWTHQQLSIDPNERNCLFSQPAHLIETDHNARWQRTLCEIGFEEMNHPGISIVSDATLASYAYCLQTALVLDFGWSCMRVVPVIEGKVQHKSIMIHPIGGFGLTQLLYEQLKSRSISLVPKNPVWSEDQITVNQRRIAADIIKNCCTFARNTIDEDFLYFLNDQRSIDVKSEMQLLAALHFNVIDSDNTTENVLPISEQIHQSIESVPDEYKRDLWSNVVTSGGFSSANSFISKLQSELIKVADPTFKVHVHFPMHRMVSGENMVWTGGSIFSSSMIFPKYLVSKEEWQENGDNILRVKCG